MTKIKVLFVCSGNVFRSMSAKFCVENYCELNNIKNVIFDSAGISVYKNKQNIREEVKEVLKNKGVDVSLHKEKNVSEVDLKNYDLIISMSYNHKRFLKEKYNLDSILFNKVCYGVNYPIYDNNEVLKDSYKGFRGVIFDKKIVNYIYSSAPYFVKNFKNFI